MSSETVTRLLYLYLVVAAGLSVFAAAKFERRLKVRLPATRSYRWGFYFGCMCFGCGPLALLTGPLMAVAGANGTWEVGGYVAFAGVCILQTFCGWFIIQRRRWAWAIGTVLSFNIFAWVINYIYGRNRWEEFGAENYNFTGGEGLALLRKAAMLDAKGRVYQSLLLYERVAEAFPGTNAARDAQKSAETLRARLGLQPPASETAALPLSLPKPVDHSLSCGAEGLDREQPESKSPQQARAEPEAAECRDEMEAVAWPEQPTRVHAAPDQHRIWRSAEILISSAAVLTLIATVCAALVWRRGSDIRSDIPNTEKAVATRETMGEILQRSARNGVANAQHSLAFDYYFGSDLDGIPKDLTQAAYWYRKAAEQGSADDQHALATMYDEGKGVPKDTVEAAKWYQRANDQYLKLADSGDVFAQGRLGWCYEYGKGVPQDYAAAANWYRKAAEQGDEMSQYSLAFFYQNGQGVPQDYREAIRWFEKLATTDMASVVQMNLVYCYRMLAGALYTGHGVPKDYAESVKWSRKAADLGDAVSQYNLGESYVSGEGVAQNHAEAAEWYRRAAEQGFAPAQAALAIRYYTGEGVARDFAQAAVWLRRGAEQGHATAEYNLGVCYARGEGVPENDTEAYMWFSLAAAQDQKGSAAARDNLAQQMGRAEIVEAQRRASAFVARRESFNDSDSPSSIPRPSITEAREKALGTAFFVSEDGYLLSNHHVVEGATAIRVKTSKGLLSAKVVKADPVNDIALLKVLGSFSALPLASNHDARQGQSVFTVGFPNVTLQGVQPKLTKGEISSLSGAQDDPRDFQISVPVQPGNSGGPLVDSSGNVVGIVTARLSDGAAFETAGALPQNVNYAIKISYALPLLEAVPGATGKVSPPHPAKERKFEDVVQETSAATALVLVY